MSEKYAIIDVETTGGRAARDRITEIAIALHDGHRLIRTFESLVNPECPIPYGITEITGITNEMVAEAPRFYEIAKEVVELTEGAVFVAHNVRFDYGFIKEEFRRLGYTYSRKQLCTVRLSKKVFPGLNSYSLGNLIRHFNITVNDRHRALADTLATVTLFENILKKQNGASEATRLVNLGIKESRLPQGITIDFLHSLPEACGVYYFHNKNGEVIYVGKSINIRKRIMEHFADQSRKAANLQKYSRDITFELTGSELVALLLESLEIKRLQPAINRAQRQKNFPYVLHTYQSRAGYICFDVAKPRKSVRKKLNVLNEYPKLNHAKGALYSVLEEFDLCPKKLHLETGKGACFNFHLKKCNGACLGEESCERYNERALQAIDYLQNTFEQPNFFILDVGRTEEEYAVVQIENGEIGGFGYVDKSYTMGNLETLRNAVKPCHSNPEMRKIVRRYLGDKPTVKIIHFT